MGQERGIIKGMPNETKKSFIVRSYELLLRQLYKMLANYI